MSDSQHSSAIQLVKCILSKGDGTDPFPIGRDMIISFIVHESIMSPFMGATITLSDSKNLIGSYPITGGEILEVELKHSYEDIPIIYKFSVYKIGGRIAKNKNQVYTLGLVSEEAIKNETTRVVEPLSGNPGGKNGVIDKLLKNSLNTTKNFYSEQSKFEMRLNPTRTRPFDIIGKLLGRHASIKSDFTGFSEASTDGESAQEVKGSAGFFFWETRRGYNFFSIDALCDTGDKNGKFFTEQLKTESWGPYKEKIANVETSGDQRFLIEGVVFNSEVDLMQSLRKGKYSSLMVFFNTSTGQYEEYQYKITNTYKNMPHLGNQDRVSEVILSTEKNITQKYSRIMSMMIDHETWYNDPGIANPEDENAKDPTKFADWQKYYAAQGIARTSLLQNQEATVKIPGNPLICAGDKVEINLQSKLPDVAKTETTYDEESSGVYLVREATHTYNFLEGDNGTLKTTLRLFRDSYGMKGKPSNHGQ